MSKENQETTLEVEQGIGTYDFSALMGEQTETEDEDVRELPDVTSEEKVEESPKEEGKPVEEEEDNKPAEEEVQPKPQTNVFSNLAKKYIENNSWEDYVVEVDGEEKSISELDNIDEELFLEIQQAQDEERNKSLKDKYIDKTELDDISLKVVDISKNGGDISEVLQIKKKFIDPLESFDLTNEAHQEDLVRQMYSMESSNLSPAQINALVEADKKSLELDTKAEAFATKLKESFNAELENRKKAAEEAVKTRQQEIKDLRKDLRNQFKEIGYKDTAMKPLIDAATVEQDKGFAIDEDFEKLKKDPKALAEFLVWRNNPEEFRKMLEKDITTKDKINTAKKLNLIRGAKKTSQTKDDKQKTSDIEEEFKSRLKIINK